MSQHKDAVSNTHMSDDSVVEWDTYNDDDLVVVSDYDDYDGQDASDGQSFSDYMHDHEDDGYYTDLSDEWLEDGLDEDLEAKFSRKARQDSWYW